MFNVLDTGSRNNKAYKDNQDDRHGLLMSEFQKLDAAAEVLRENPEVEMTMRDAEINAELTDERFPDFKATVAFLKPGVVMIVKAVSNIKDAVSSITSAGWNVDASMAALLVDMQNPPQALIAVAETQAPWCTQVFDVSDHSDAAFAMGQVIGMNGEKMHAERHIGITPYVAPPWSPYKANYG